MDWEAATPQSLSANCTIIAMRERAKWHRQEAKNFCRHSVNAMHQHACDAESLERTANKLEQLEIARAAVRRGLYKSVLEGYSLERGHYIEVQTDLGWEPFWCENKHLKNASNASV